jgi:uncharacterized SAM-binding protein YcdF (DUF218 family)
MAVVSYTEPLLALLLSIALIRLLRLRQDRWALLAVLGIALLSWPAADWLISRPLEARYPARLFQADEAPEAIVVLASSVNPPTSYRPFALLGEDTFKRCEMALWLHQQLPAAPILTCGGRESRHSPPYAVTMRDYLVRAGVARDLIWTEERSASTHENAVFGAEILHRHGVRRIALVVDSQSMLRAEACFRREGLTVIAAPSAFRVFGPLSRECLPSWSAIRRNEGALHEGVGLLWYKLRGWI